MDGPSQSVGAYRAQYQSSVPRYYNGWVHLGFTLTGASAAIVYGALQLSRPTPWEWFVVPIGFFFANFVEYLGHRYPMHHPMGPLSILYKRHAGSHHRYFTDVHMEAETSRDLIMVLFPPSLLIFFLGLIASPLAYGLYRWVSPNVGWLFLCTAMGYFLIYEVLHSAYHAPEQSIVGRLPGMQSLKRHHAVHHDPTKMRTWNFNITFPIADAVFRTTFRG